MLARAAISSEAWGPLPRSVVVGRIQLLVVVALKSYFLAGCLSPSSSKRLLSGPNRVAISQQGGIKVSMIIAPFC